MHELETRRFFWLPVYINLGDGFKTSGTSNSGRDMHTWCVVSIFRTSVGEEIRLGRSRCRLTLPVCGTYRIFFSFEEASGPKIDRLSQPNLPSDPCCRPGCHGPIERPGGQIYSSSARSFLSGVTFQPSAPLYASVDCRAVSCRK